MKALVVFSALLVATVSQNIDDYTESNATENNTTTEDVPRPGCKCALRPAVNPPIPVPPPMNPNPPQVSFQTYPNPQVSAYPGYPGYAIRPPPFNPYQPTLPQSFNRYPPPPFSTSGPVPPRSPGRRSSRAAPLPYAHERQPVREYESPMPSQGGAVQVYNPGGSSYQSDYQYAQGSQQSEQSYRGDPNSYWYDSDPAPVQQSPVQQVYYEVPQGYSEYNTPVRQMPVQQVLVMRRY